MNEAIRATHYRNNHLPNTQWVKSPFSDLDHSKDCVLFAELGDGTVGITDSKDPDAPVLRMKRSEISAWVQGAKAGAFDSFTNL
ncbi:DUF397 domain-containing protein [Streptomyces beijiangensis]|uniref:DUF397 domain-containing protein n=1 Tax=Streptomyces beijiangensis TaxID=163361 RepID=A0A939FCG6_9ACTN|nr:DUF397 domain-containing protein [Streptomyces beijiangensis]MBO0515574.1 DUF397 domain-containing protein [Streptomyces beijiangensis]